MRVFSILPLALTPLALIFAAPADAQNVNLVGTVLNQCVLTVATPGTLGVAPNGTELGTATSIGGIAAILGIVATNASATVSFTVPVLNGPSTGNATSTIAYASPGGANRALDGAAYSYTMNRLIDTVTIAGHVSNPNGFRNGLYTLSTTATCSQ